MTMELAERLDSHNGEMEASNRRQLILDYLPYVKRVVNRIVVHLPSGVEREDLYNVGVIGLIQAIDRFDPSRDNKFTTYAVFRIRGAVLSELRSRDFLSRLSRRKIRELDRACAKLEQRLGRPAEAAELAAEMGITLDELHHIKQMSSISFISFDELEGSTAMEKKKLFHGFLREDEDVLSKAGLMEVQSSVAEAIEELPEKEKLVLSLYYDDELTMKETGGVLGITESRVSQLHSQAIARIRAKLRKKKLLKDD
jgi:RNA polymerase sigma factor for flagellar operon FliA